MKRALLTLALFPFAAACSHNPPKPEGLAVIIKQGHYHTRYCGHYRYGNQWYFIEQHRHGVDCGHELVNGEWILADS